MVPRHTPEAAQSLPSIRDIKKQLHTIEDTLKALKPDHALEWVRGHALVPAGYTGSIAVARPDNFGLYRLPATCEAWGRATGLKLQTRIPGLATSEHRSFQPDTFRLDERTAAAFERLDAQKVCRDKSDDNRLRVFAVRMTREPNPELSEGEFHLDLASLMWLLVSHPKWKQHEGELLFRCLGERHNTGHGEETLFVGYRDFRVLLRHKNVAHPGISVIGYAPSIEQ